MDDSAATRSAMTPNISRPQEIGRARAGEPDSRPFLRAALWSAGYVALVAFPLVVLLRGRLPPGGGYAWDFAMALGFGGLAMLALQSALTARFRRATAPFGVDIIYYFHRWAAVAGVGLVAGHYLILRFVYSDAIGPMNPLDAAWPMTAGRVAFVLFLVLIVSSLGRQALHLDYDRWRVGHAVLAVAAMVLAMAHIWGVGHYTAAADKGLMWGVYTAGWVLVVGYVRLLRPWALCRKPYTVTAVRPERGASWTLTVKPVGHGGFSFCAGQFAWLTLRASPFRAKEHPFSIANSAAAGGSLQFTIKELGDFTRTIKAAQLGDVAYVDGPHGIFTCDRYPHARKLIFIAGGIGIAPIMSMLRTLADRADVRPLRLIYGNRCWENVVFREELDLLSTRLDFQVVHVLQEPPADWRGVSGLLSEDVLRAAIGPDVRGAHFFVCGPKPMSDAVQRTLRRLRVPLHGVHSELFDMV